MIVGFAVNDDGATRELSWSEVSQSPAAQAGERRWLHLDRLQVPAREWLEGSGALDPLIVGILFQEDTRPRAARYENGILLNLRGANLNPGAEPTDRCCQSNANQSPASSRAGALIQPEVGAIQRGRRFSSI